MADNAVVHVGENSPEYVAYRLLEHIAVVESKGMYKGGGADRRWILDTYAECLLTVRNPIRTQRP